MRNILLYRTPTSLRAYRQVFLNIFPILSGPYFAKLCSDSYEAVGYGVAVVYSIVLVSLDNIQEDLENPFDGVGDDDMSLDVAEQYSKILETGLVCFKDICLLFLNPCNCENNYRIPGKLFS